jgi:nucleotide-binding universal stress UspA family protein
MSEAAKNAVCALEGALDRPSGLFGRDLASSFPPPVIEAPRVAEPFASSAPYRVLVASDLSELCEAVFVEGLRFARARPPAELHVLTVVRRAHGKYRVPFDPTRQSYTPEQVQDKMAASLRHALSQRRPQLEGLVDKVSIHVSSGDTASEILRFANAILADLIVLGARDYRGWKRRVWGSIYRTVAAHAAVSVVVSRPGDYSHGNRVPVVAPPSVRAAAATWLRSSLLYERGASSDVSRRSGEVPMRHVAAP